MKCGDKERGRRKGGNVVKAVSKDWQWGRRWKKTQKLKVKSYKGRETKREKEGAKGKE